MFLGVTINKDSAHAHVGRSETLRSNRHVPAMLLVEICCHARAGIGAFERARLVEWYQGCWIYPRAFAYTMVNGLD